MEPLSHSKHTTELSCRKLQTSDGQTNNHQQNEVGLSGVASLDISPTEISTSYKLSDHGTMFRYYTMTMNDTSPFPDVHLFKIEATNGHYTRDKEE
jgi:hypothetical protein